MKILKFATIALNFASAAFAQSTSNFNPKSLKNTDSIQPEKNSRTLSLPVQQPGLYMIPTDSGEIQFAINDLQGTKIVSAAVFSSATEDTLKKVKAVVCGFSLKPTTVEISMGFASASWEVKELCK